MPIRNCWEFKSCGREPGGRNVETLGECPTATNDSVHGINRGTNGGRICWSVSGHYSEDGEIRCATAKQLVTCMACEFFKTVLREEGIDHIVFIATAAGRRASSTSNRLKRAHDATGKIATGP